MVVVVPLARLGVGCSCKLLVVQVELGRAVAHNHVEEVENRLLVAVPGVVEQTEVILEDQRRVLHPERYHGPGHAASSPQYAPVVYCR